MMQEVFHIFLLLLNLSACSLDQQKQGYTKSSFKISRDIRRLGLPDYIDKELYERKLADYNKKAPFIVWKNEDNNDKRIEGMIPQIRIAIIHAYCGGDLERVPEGLGSPTFYRALMTSKIPERAIKFFESSFIYHSDVARQLWQAGDTSRVHDPYLPKLIDWPTHPKRFARKYLGEHPGVDFFHTVAKIFRFPSAVKVIGDGNCFYRSFLYGMILHLRYCSTSVETRDFVLEKLERTCKPDLMDEVALNGCKLLKMAVGFGPTRPISFWHSSLNSAYASDAIIYTLRSIVSIEARKPKYSQFIQGDVEKYIKETVLAMTVWAGEIEAAILSNFFDLDVTITDLANQRRQVVREGKDANEVAPIELIYNGKHYDLFDISEDMHAVQEGVPYRLK